MTTHELAKKLLEGPDVMVVHAVDVGYGCEEEPSEIDSAAEVVLYQANHSGYYGDLLFDRPRNESLDVREVRAVKLS